MSTTRRDREQRLGDVVPNHVDIATVYGRTGPYIYDVLVVIEKALNRRDTSAGYLASAAGRDVCAHSHRKII